MYGDEAQIRNSGRAGKSIKRLVEEFKAKPEEVFMCFVYFATDPFNASRTLGIETVVNNLDGWRSSGCRMLNPKADDKMKTKVRQHLQQQSGKQGKVEQQATSARADTEQNGHDMQLRLRLLSERSGSAMSIDDVL
jgi:hypothetical protein